MFLCSKSTNSKLTSFRVKRLLMFLVLRREWMWLKWKFRDFVVKLRMWLCISYKLRLMKSNLLLFAKSWALRRKSLSIFWCFMVKNVRFLRNCVRLWMIWIVLSVDMLCLWRLMSLLLMKFLVRLKSNSSS